MSRSSRDQQFESFAKACYPSLLRTAQLLCGGDRAAGEDLLQTALLKTYLSWRRLRDRQNANAYARTTMIRTLISEHRRPSTSEIAIGDVSDVSESASGEREYDTAVDRLDAMAALRTLPTRQRAAIVLRYYVGMSEAETANHLACSVPSVKQLTARGIAKIRSGNKSVANEWHEEKL